jgi:hypothetical protein
VVRDEILRLVDELHELADPPVAASELDDELPPQRIAQQPEDLRGLGRYHTSITSVWFDALQIDGSIVSCR